MKTRKTDNHPKTHGYQQTNVINHLSLSFSLGSGRLCVTIQWGTICSTAYTVLLVHTKIETQRPSTYDHLEA